MATIEYARGQKASISPTPKELIFFSLAKEFGWLPSEVEAEPSKNIKGIMHVLSTYNSARRADTDRGGRKASLGMVDTESKKFIDVTDPEVERQLQQGQLIV
jgi:hypothetical protein